jgi:hypothetical protein
VREIQNGGPAQPVTKIAVRVLLIGALVGWIAVWLPVFGLSFSPSIFQYHRGTRLPALILSLLAIAVPPVSGYWAVTRTIWRKAGALRAFGTNLVVSGAPVFLYWSYHAIVLHLARKKGELAFEADEAMGIGIIYLLCVAIFVGLNVVVGIVLIGIQVMRRRR